MSADNWSICPRCETNLRARQQRKTAEIMVQYGHIPADEFLEKIDTLKKRWLIKESGLLEPTLREDYEQGLTEKGQYYSFFSAFCHVCQFTFTHRVVVEREQVIKQTDDERRALDKIKLL